MERLRVGKGCGREGLWKGMGVGGRVKEWGRGRVRMWKGLGKNGE